MKREIFDTLLSLFVVLALLLLAIFTPVEAWEWFDELPLDLLNNGEIK